MKKSKKVKMIRFKGWDFTEIAKPLGIKLGARLPKAQAVCYPCGNMDHEIIAKELWNRMSSQGPSWPGGEVRICRAYLKALSKAAGVGYDKPAILGILAIKDNYVFMGWFIANLARLWS